VTDVKNGVVLKMVGDVNVDVSVLVGNGVDVPADCVDTSTVFVVCGEVFVVISVDDVNRTVSVVIPVDVFVGKAVLVTGRSV